MLHSCEHATHSHAVSVSPGRVGIYQNENFKQLRHIGAELDDSCINLEALLRCDFFFMVWQEKWAGLILRGR